MDAPALFTGTWICTKVSEVGAIALLAVLSDKRLGVASVLQHAGIARNARPLEGAQVRVHAHEAVWRFSGTGWPLCMGCVDQSLALPLDGENRWAPLPAQVGASAPAWHPQQGAHVNARRTATGICVTCTVASTPAASGSSASGLQAPIVWQELWAYSAADDTCDVQVSVASGGRRICCTVCTFARAGPGTALGAHSKVLNAAPVSARIVKALSPDMPEASLLHLACAMRGALGGVHFPLLRLEAAESSSLGPASPAAASLSPAAAASPSVELPAMHGAWQVDSSQSDSPDALMKALGVPWAARAVGNRLHITTTWSPMPRGEEHPQGSASTSPAPAWGPLRIKQVDSSSLGAGTTYTQYDGQWRPKRGDDGKYSLSTYLLAPAHIGHDAAAQAAWAFNCACHGVQQARGHADEPVKALVPAEQPWPEPQAPWPARQPSFKLESAPSTYRVHADTVAEWAAEAKQQSKRMEAVACAPTAVGVHVLPEGKGVTVDIRSNAHSQRGLAILSSTLLFQQGSSSPAAKCNRMMVPVAPPPDAEAKACALRAKYADQGDTAEYDNAAAVATPGTPRTMCDECSTPASGAVQPGRSASDSSAATCSSQPRAVQLTSFIDLLRSGIVAACAQLPAQQCAELQASLVSQANAAAELAGQLGQQPLIANPAAAAVAAAGAGTEPASPSSLNANFSTLPDSAPVPIVSPVALDLCGTWAVDAGGSEPLEPVLQAAGVSWLARRLVRSLDVQYTLALGACEWQVLEHSKVGMSSIAVPLSGLWHLVQLQDGRVSPVRACVTTLGIVRVETLLLDFDARTLVQGKSEAELAAGLDAALEERHSSVSGSLQDALKAAVVATAARDLGLPVQAMRGHALSCCNEADLAGEGSPVARGDFAADWLWDSLLHECKRLVETRTPVDMHNCMHNIVVLHPTQQAVGAVRRLYRVADWGSPAELGPAEWRAHRAAAAAKGLNSISSLLRSASLDCGHASAATDAGSPTATTAATARDAAHASGSMRDDPLAWVATAALLVMALASWSQGGSLAVWLPAAAVSCALCAALLLQRTAPAGSRSAGKPKQD